jgi:hypothetical protein
MSRIGIAALAASALAVTLAACGSEQTMTAQEFVEQVSRQGVDVRIGEPLVTDEGKELYALELGRLAGPRVDSRGRPISTDGSVSAFDSTEDADGEFAQCREMADLLCYRLDNIVVVLEGGGLETRQLAVAMKRLAD